MDPITLAIVAGVGSYMGGKSNRRRQEQAEGQLDILQNRLEASGRAKDRYATRFKGSMENAALESNESSRADAAKAFQNESAMEAGAGRSGTTGGTPFYLMGKVAAESHRAVTVANTMRANRLESMRLEGVEGLEQYEDQAREVERSIKAGAEELNYISSPLGWALSMATGAASAVQMANGFETALEGTGRPADKDLAASKNSNNQSKAAGDQQPKVSLFGDGGILSFFGSSETGQPASPGMGIGYKPAPVNDLGLAYWKKLAGTDGPSGPQFGLPNHQASDRLFGAPSLLDENYFADIFGAN